MEVEKNIPRYESIAYQIALKISNEDILERTKLSGRSLLSSEYNVSSETIRKAMRALEQFEVVQVKEQSGIFVISKDNAKTYVDYYHKKNGTHNIKLELAELVDAQKLINQKILKKIKMISDATQPFPFRYFSYYLDENSKHLNETIEQLDFYTNTKGIIIAYENNDVIYQVPDPGTILEKGFILYILGDKIVKQKVIDFFKR